MRSLLARQVFGRDGTDIGSDVHSLSGEYTFARWEHIADQLYL